VVVGYAPQFDLAGPRGVDAHACRTQHVLDSLANAVPLVTVPITYEQPRLPDVSMVGRGPIHAVRRAQRSAPEGDSSAMSFSSRRS